MENKLEIKVGERYKLRNGDEILVIHMLSDNNLYPIISISNENRIYHHKKNGLNSNSIYSTSNFDIVEKIKDEINNKEIKFIVGHYYETRSGIAFQLFSKVEEMKDISSKISNKFPLKFRVKNNIFFCLTEKGFQWEDKQSDFDIVKHIGENLPEKLFKKSGEEYLYIKPDSSRRNNIIDDLFDSDVIFCKNEGYKKVRIKYEMEEVEDD